VKKIILFGLYILLLGIICCAPMGNSPAWNGQEANNSKDQYEIMADSILKGKLYLDVEVDEKLKNLVNPYDPQSRVSNGVSYRWDTAYYNGHYYMYFGVLPTFMFFIPFKLITGRSLVGYHATQAYVFLIIIGFFLFFRFLRKCFFPKMGEIAFFLLTTASIFSTVWYFVEAPALYCTAISGAVCMIVWSLYFYFRAVFDEFSFKQRIIYATCGALFGALAFSCRPTVAMANVVAIPLFIVFLKKNKIELSSAYRIIPIFIPYLVIGFLIMTYNYLRFENPFDFGQSYNLTVYDMTQYTSVFNVKLVDLLNFFNNILFSSNGFNEEFPYLDFGGVLFEFPIYFIGVGLLVLNVQLARQLKKENLLGAICMLLAASVMIIISMAATTPVIYERYHTDIYFCYAILSFLTIGNLYSLDYNNKVLEIIISTLAIYTIISSGLYYMVPNDLNYTEYYPEVLDHIRQVLNG